MCVKLFSFLLPGPANDSPLPAVADRRQESVPSSAPAQETIHDGQGEERDHAANRCHEPISRGAHGELDHLQSKASQRRRQSLPL